MISRNAVAGNGKERMAGWHGEGAMATAARLLWAVALKIPRSCVGVDVELSVAREIFVRCGAVLVSADPLQSNSESK
jgi:hypothetical protein